MSLNSIDNTSNFQSVQNSVQSAGTNPHTTLLQDTVVVNENAASSNVHSMNNAQNVETKRTVTKNNLLSHLKNLINDLINKLKNLFPNAPTTPQGNQEISDIKSRAEQLRNHLTENTANVKDLSLEHMAQYVQNNNIKQEANELLSSLTKTIDSTSDQTLKNELSNSKTELKQLLKNHEQELMNQLDKQVTQYDQQLQQVTQEVQMMQQTSNEFKAPNSRR